MLTRAAHGGRPVRPRRRAFAEWALGLCLGLVGLAIAARAEVIRVGPGRAVDTIAKASALVRRGDTVEVDAGTYRRDVAVWSQDDVTVRAVRGRARLIADGAAINGKGIWVVRAHRMRVEGFDFEGAVVPSRNGAGIRFDFGSLTVVDCSFTHNEMGLLTNNDPDTLLEIVNSEFAYNRRADGQGNSHQLYVGEIARLSVTGSNFHHADRGHLLKSRAAVNEIVRNRLGDERGGTASYELEFPNGGIAHVVGNVIRQGAETQNPNVISYGVEGYRWPANELTLIDNTLIDELPSGGEFLRVSPGGRTRIEVIGNRLIGRGRFDQSQPGTFRNNQRLEAESALAPR